jgi:glycosyltransferase involved in cell wall biosynthesis
MLEKVVHIITRLDMGGSAQNTMLTVLGHDRERFEPVVFIGAPGSADAQGGQAASDANRQRLAARGIRCAVIASLRRPVRPLRDLLALFALLRMLRAERPVVVHTHTSKAGILGRLAAWIVGVPVVIHTPHGHVFYGHFGRAASWLALQVERLWAKRTTRLIALTETERDEHLTRGVGRMSAFVVIPSGVELDRFWNVPADSRQRQSHQPSGWPCPPEASVVGSVGWLTPVKGHGVLLEAVARVRPRQPNLHVVIIGSGPLRQQLTVRAGMLGIGHMVHLLDVRSDIPECLAAMDLFVLPSLNEGMGRALVEAMAAGRPVIASCVGGVPAIIEHGKTGLLVPPGDVEALAEAMAQLLSNPSLSRELGEAARKRIDLSFGVRAMVRSIEAVYQDALRQRGAR